MPWKPTVHRPAGAKSSAEVKRELDRQRPSAARRGYDARWRRARSRYLAEHPWCVHCLVEGRRTPATVVDHVEPHRGDERLFWDQDQWQVLCKQHHDAKTVRDGRWGQRHLSDGAARSIYGCDVHGMPLDPNHPWNRPGGVGRSWRTCR
jgi:5-methylcytosine-specific restriction enzyme A